MILTRMSLYFKLVPVQFQDYDMVYFTFFIFGNFDVVALNNHLVVK